MSFEEWVEVLKEKKRWKLSLGEVNTLFKDTDVYNSTRQMGMVVSALGGRGRGGASEQWQDFRQEK